MTMIKLKKFLQYFTLADYLLWSISMTVIISTFVIFNTDPLSFVASLIGITALIFCAKGNPIGQILMIVFCCFYAVISYTFSYYGELMTYMFMSLPMSTICLISWLKHPSSKGRSQVQANRLNKKDFLFISIGAVVVTTGFYFVLEALSTPNLFVSTISVTTSFTAAFLTYKRSPFYALAYALNDLVLITLWVLATFENPVYLSTVIIFITFLANDLHGFSCWIKMRKEQNV